MVIPYTLCFYTSFSLISLVFAHNPKMFPLIRIVSYKTLPHAIIIYYIVSSSLSLHHLPLWPHTSLSVPHSWSISSLKTAPYFFFCEISQEVSRKKKTNTKNFLLIYRKCRGKMKRVRDNTQKAVKSPKTNALRCGDFFLSFFQTQNRPKMPVFVLMKRTNW